MASNPEVGRLIPELFRRVAIPYSGGFSVSASSLVEIVNSALAGNRIAPKHAVAMRLSPGRNSPSGKNPTTHLDEFAVAFGFLEEAGSSYFAGKYGLVGMYVQHASRRVRHLDVDRATRAILLSALLDRHGDFVLPVLRTAGSPGAPDAFVSMVRDNVAMKRTRWVASDLPRNAAYREGLKVLSSYLGEWGLAEERSSFDRPVPIPRHADRSEEKKQKTRDGYFSRTTTYLVDLGLVSRGMNVSVTETGRSLLDAVDAKGLGGKLEIPPSFEAVHDAFSVPWTRYEAVFVPPTRQETFESLVSSALLPGRPLRSWTDVPELSEEFLHIVEGISESLSGSARLDAVRLAMFAYCVGIGVAVRLDSVTPDEDVNGNAAVEIPLANPRRFSLGHARNGRRFWSVTLKRT